MSNNKQSSVDWLIGQLQKSKDWHRVLNEISQMSSSRVDIIDQAKAMHKEEITQAWKNGCKIGVDVGSNHDYHEGYNSEQYYNETFNNEQTN